MKSESCHYWHSFSAQGNLSHRTAFDVLSSVVLVYALSEQAAYHLSELIEDHAYETYDNYLKEHAETLKTKPVPPIAHKYYELDNPFLFDLFCTVKEADEEGNFSARRPKLETLYDVFVNVRDDEREHWKTLCNLVQYNDMQGCANSKVRATEAVARQLATLRDNN
jgi:ubiquinol oxidase